MREPARCPDNDAIAAFAEARLPNADRAVIESHLAQCASCHSRLAELARMDAAAPALTHTVTDESPAPDQTTDAPPLHPGDRLDGLLLERRLGSGAMGEVWLADDPELHRQVAVKLLRRERHDPRSSNLLRQEARSLAQLSHPNVVAVHGVAEANGRGYIAMEYVAGVTLRAWLAIGHPTLSERLDVMIQAGRGLAAAHRAGIVHRDFKPSNVLVGADGRVRVSDFGLARLQRVDAATGNGPGDVSAQTSVAGTPVYMAPEQLRGGKATLAGDQYSFAVSLHEAVHGVRPFAGTNPEALLHAIERGTPERRVRVPGWLRVLMQRALSAEPAGRFESMDALVAALEAGLRRRRRVLVGAAMVAVAVLTSAIAIPIARRATAAAPGCGGEAEAMARVWNPTRATTIRSQLERIGGPFGVEQWGRAAPLLDDHARRWVAMRRETCEATQVRHVQSDNLFDRRMYCLDRRIAQLDGLAGTLEHLEDRKLVERVLELVSGLPSLDACTDSHWLSDEPTPPIAIRSGVDEAFKALEAGRALGLQGRYKEALAAYRALEARARELAFAPLLADLAFETAYAADRTRDFALAESEYERATSLASELHRTDRVFAAQAQAMRMEGFQQHFDRALGRASTLAGLASLSPDPEHPSLYHQYLGDVYSWQGRQADAIKEYRQAIALLPPDTRSGEREASARQGLGNSLMGQGELDAAEPELRRALALREQRYGPRHPEVVKALSYLGTLHWHRAQYDKALEVWQRALAIQEAVSDKDGAEIARPLGNVAMAQSATGDLAGALASFNRALELSIRYYGPEHPEVASVMANKGNLLMKLRRYDESEALARQGIAMREKVQGKDHPELVRANLLLGGLLLDKAAHSIGARARDAYAAALPPLTHGVELCVVKFGPRHQLRGRLLIQRARALFALGRFPAARADAELGLSILLETFAADIDTMQQSLAIVAELRLEGGEPMKVVELLEAPMKKRDKLEDVDAAKVAFVLARAWWQIGRRDEAVALAKRALAAFETDAEGDVERAAMARRVRVWLAPPR